MPLIQIWNASQASTEKKRQLPAALLAAAGKYSKATLDETTRRVRGLPLDLPGSWD